MNFFKLYIGDYQRDTAHLSIAEHGAYLLMLQHYYATEKPLPTGKALHRMLRAQDKEERDAIDRIAAEFWITTPDGLVNNRADKERAKSTWQAETNRATAQAREAARRESRNEHETSTNRVTKEALRARDSHSQTPDTSVPSEQRHPPTPRKRGKPAAPALWSRPDWVPAREWEHFETHRRAMRGVPFTDAARDGVVRQLADLKAKGYDPAGLLSEAVTRGWRTVFEPKAGSVVVHAQDRFAGAL